LNDIGEFFCSIVDFFATIFVSSGSNGRKRELNIECLNCGLVFFKKARIINEIYKESYSTNESRQMVDTKCQNCKAWRACAVKLPKDL